MGVPAGPKLDFVGASEVRDQVYRYIKRHLRICLQSVFLSADETKKYFNLQLHRCEDTPFQLDSIRGERFICVVFLVAIYILLN